MGHNPRAEKAEKGRGPCAYWTSSPAYLVTETLTQKNRAAGVLRKDTRGRLLASTCTYVHMQLHTYKHIEV